MKTNNGFSLIELLVVIAVIGILGAISMPYYNDYVTRAKLVEATSALSDGRIKMEQYFQDNRTYVGGPTPAATTNFQYVVSGTSPTTYTITATMGRWNGAVFTPLPAASLFAYSIDQTNTRRTTAVATGWAPTDSGGVPLPLPNCWITKKKSC